MKTLKENKRKRADLKVKLFLIKNIELYVAFMAFLFPLLYSIATKTFYTKTYIITLVITIAFIELIIKKYLITKKQKTQAVQELKKEIESLKV